MSLLARFQVARARAHAVGGLRLWQLSLTPEDYYASLLRFPCPVRLAPRSARSTLWCLDPRFPALVLHPFPLEPPVGGSVSAHGLGASASSGVRALSEAPGGKHIIAGQKV